MDNFASDESRNFAQDIHAGNFSDDEVYSFLRNDDSWLVRRASVHYLSKRVDYYEAMLYRHLEDEKHIKVIISIIEVLPVNFYFARFLIRQISDELFYFGVKRFFVHLHRDLIKEVFLSHITENRRVALFDRIHHDNEIIGEIAHIVPDELKSVQLKHSNMYNIANSIERILKDSKKTD